MLQRLKTPKEIRSMECLETWTTDNPKASCHLLLALKGLGKPTQGKQSAALGLQP